MSAAIKQFAADELSELSFAFRQNCALKNGLPDCKKVAVKLPDDPPPKEPAAPIVNITNQIPAAPAANSSPSPGATAVAAVKSSLLRRAAPWLLATAFGSAAVSGPLGWLLHRSEQPANSQPPTQAEQDRSMLQWLQDNGQHLRPGATWQQQ